MLGHISQASECPTDHCTCEVLSAFLPALEGALRKRPTEGNRIYLRPRAATHSALHAIHHLAP
eukprot:2413395-Pyramimonas_sp.AAC.1